ncbi:MAG: adenylate/guanylate cyclase domain-containing protein [bacterium]|nr:adenylate/guanylate cyclase domain-containing protein [bacterium]MCP4966234.1 adenylate/guanylate cyclase domain-containing protein [bacterium]
MSRKDKKRRTKLSAADMRGTGVNVKDLSSSIKQLVATRIAEKYAEDPDKFARLVEVGLVDEATLSNLPNDVDFDAAVSKFRERLTAIVAEEPSVLGRLEVRPLDVLCEAEPAPAKLPGTEMSVIFSDLEGFTSFTSSKGDLEASALLRDHYDTVASIVRGRGGSVIKTIGDGHMLAFGQSQAAVLAAVELSEIVAGPLRLRVGGHNGDVVKTTDDILGHVVNVAARVTDAASGGETLVTTALRDSAGAVRGVEFDVPAAIELRGIEDPFQLCRAHRM